MDMINYKSQNVLYIVYTDFLIKIGKTIHRDNIKHSYSRLTEVKYLFYECKNIDIGEAIILNLFGPYRLGRTNSYNSSFISEEIDIKLLTISFIDFVIKHICNYINNSDVILPTINVSRSKNTINEYRKQIPSYIIHNLCMDIHKHLSPKNSIKKTTINNFAVPMDTGSFDDNNIEYDINIFDKFVKI